MPTALEELDELQRRPGRDLTVDQEVGMVDLRRRAYAELQDPPRPVWPPTYPDPAPGGPRLVTIDREELSADLIGGALQHHGCLRVDHLLDPEQVTALRRDIDKAFQARPDYGRPHGKPGRRRFYSRFEADKGNPDNFGKRNHLRLADTPRGMGDIIRFYREAGLVDAIADYLGQRPALSVNKSSMRRVKPGFSLDYHQDGAFLGGDIRTVNVWLALTRCGVDAPGLDFIPARTPSVLETGTNGAAFDWTVSADSVDALQLGHPVIRPEFRPGDALLFDQMLVHRTGNDESMTKDRLAIESWFFAPEGYPDHHCPLVV